jgi:transcription elongation factor GreB
MTRKINHQKSPYITARGFENLQIELDGLWQKRRKVVTALSAAAAEGDRSENAEYIYRKKQLREIDRRVRYLQKRLPELQVVASAPTQTDRVYFGAQVTLEDEDGKANRYRIVGTDEFDPKRNSISIDSPLARALLKATRDDEITVHTPSGEKRYYVIAIEYPVA